MNASSRGCVRGSESQSRWQDRIVRILLRLVRDSTQGILTLEQRGIDGILRVHSVS